MQIKTYKNKYDHDVVDCPFCPYFAYVRPITKVSPDPLRDLKRHITNAAKNEAFTRLLLAEAIKTPHFDYYKEHTNERPIVKSMGKRQYDDDMKI